MAYWALFFLTGAGAVLAAKWLDDQERRRWQVEAPELDRAHRDVR